MIFRAPTIAITISIAIVSNTVYLMPQSCILIASPDFVQLPNPIPKLIKMDELENILANSIYKQVTYLDTPWHLLSHLCISLSQNFCENCLKKCKIAGPRGGS